MPYRIVDKETGFIMFKRTPDEKNIADLQKENESLKEGQSRLEKEMAELKKLIRKK